MPLTVWLPTRVVFRDIFSRPRIDMVTGGLGSAARHNKQST